MKSQTVHAAIEERERVLTAFLKSNQERIARACHEMARAFSRGGTLIPFGTDAAATDAAHVAVEFMHPVIVGKRALPALAPTNDPTGRTVLTTVGRADDIALAICHGPPVPEVERFLTQAAERGMLTVALTGAEPAEAEHPLTVEVDHPDVVQELQETAYHILWELVHTFFEHPGLLDDACITCGDAAVEATVVAVRNGSAIIEKNGAREEIAVELVGGVEPGDRVLCHAGVVLEKLTAPDHEEPDDPSGFLYPFLAAEERDLEAVLSDVRASIVRKGADVTALRRAIDVAAVEECGRSVRPRLDAGGALLAFGNGGSSTDAQDAAADFLARGWPAAALTNDAATVTAVGNDVGYDNVFARQLIALGRANDVALGISTSGSSPNIVAALEEAHRREMLTCAITGYDGGRLAELDWLDHLLVVHGDYIPRLQEAHATIYHLMLESVGTPR